MKFTISNPEMIPPDLPPGKYTTRVVSATFEEIVVEYLGKYYDPNDPCLLPLTKEESKGDTDWPYDTSEHSEGSDILMPEPHGAGYGVDDSMENPDKY